MVFFKKLFLVLFLALLGGLVASFIFIADPPKNEIASAIDLGTPAKNIFGWAWSDNIGWISFNCVQSFCSENRTIRCDSDSDCSGTCEFDTVDCSDTSNYGVSYNSSTRALSGYAWGDNIGWISFDREETGNPPEDPYVSGGGPIAYYNADGTVTGWAKIINMSSDTGWIKFNHGRANPVTVLNNEFLGWAWNGDDNGTPADTSDDLGIGWISFNCANQSECGTSNYKTYINNTPVASDLSAELSAPCGGGEISAILSWSYDDGDEGATDQYAYEIEVRSSGGALVLDTGKVIASTNQKIMDSGLDYNQTYDWQVKVWDNYNLVSEWATAQFYTPDHEFPSAEFTWGPSAESQGTSFSPKALEDVYFASEATAYGGASIASTDWTFADALPNASTTPNPGPVQFQSAGAKEVSLEVTDSDGYSCSLSQSITSQMSLPIWEEIKPE